MRPREGSILYVTGRHSVQRKLFPDMHTEINSRNCGLEAVPGTPPCNTPREPGGWQMQIRVQKAPGQISRFWCPRAKSWTWGIWTHGRNTDNLLRKRALLNVEVGQRTERLEVLVVFGQEVVTDHLHKHSFLEIMSLSQFGEFQGLVCLFLCCFVFYQLASFIVNCNAWLSPCSRPERCRYQEADSGW